MHNTAGKNYVNAVISYLIAAVENLEFSTRKIEYNQPTHRAAKNNKLIGNPLGLPYA